MPSNIVAYEWPLNSTVYMAYETDDDYIHEMVVGHNGKLCDNDITTITDAPKLEEAILAGFTWEDGHTQLIAFASATNANGHIYEFFQHQDQPWRIEDIMKKCIDAAPADGFALIGQLLGVPEASEDVITAHEWTPEFAKHIVYLDIADLPHIHSLMLKHGGKWHHTDLTGSTGSPSIALLRAGK